MGNCSKGERKSLMDRLWCFLARLVVTGDNLVTGTGSSLSSDSLDELSSGEEVSLPILVFLRHRLILGTIVCKYTLFTNI